MVDLIASGWKFDEKVSLKSCAMAVELKGDSQSPKLIINVQEKYTQMFLNVPQRGLGQLY